MNLVTFADDDEIVRQFGSFRVAMLEVSFEVRAVAADDVGKFGHRHEQTEYLLEAVGFDFGAVGDVAQADLAGAEFEQDSVHFGIALHILLALFARHLIQRRLGDINVAALHQLRHLTEKERQQQRADVTAVHVSIGHDDDFVIAELFEIEAALHLAVATDTGADGGDHGLDFLIREDLLQPSLLGVDELTTQRQNGLVVTIAAHFGGATGGVTLDNKQLSLRRIALGAVGEFARQTAAAHGVLADGLAGTSGGLAGLGGDDDVLDDLQRHVRIFIKVTQHALIHDGVHHAFDFAVHELHLRLRIEARMRMFDAQHANHTLAAVIALDLRHLLFEGFRVAGDVLLHRLRERGFEARVMCAKVRVRNRIGKAERLLAEAFVVLNDAIDEDELLLVLQHHLAATRDHDRLRMHLVFALAEFIHELLHAFRIDQRLTAGSLTAFIGDLDGDARIQEGQLAETSTQAIKNKGRRDRKDRHIWEEGDLRAGALRIIEVAKHFERLGGDAALKADGVDLSIAIDLALEPIGKRIHALRADAVQAAGEFIRSVAELAARVQIREHQLDRRHAFGVHLDWNTASVVLDADGAVGVDGDPDVFAIACEMLVDRVIHHFEHTVVQTAFIRLTDIHARPHAHGSEAFQVLDLFGTVSLISSNGGGV